MRCGFYETEITPPLGASMFGYFNKRTVTGVKEKLFTKAAVFEQDGTYAALLIVDASCIPMGLPAVVKKRVSEQTEIDENAIIIAATHSHVSLPVRLGTAPEQDPALDQAVLDMTAMLAADAVILAYQRLAPVHIRFATGRAEGISFVREYYIKDGSIRTNPGYCAKDVVKPYSDPDYDLPVFFVTDEAGKPLGAITSFALHHDTVHGTECSSDFSGLVAKQLKRCFGDRFITLFFSGFCGNINHFNYLEEVTEWGAPAHPLTTQQISEVLTKSLLEAITKAEPLPEDALSIKRETIRIKKRELEPGFLDSVKALVKNPPGPGPMTIADPYSDRMKYASSKTVLSFYDENKETEFDVPVMVMKLGDALIYSFIGEVFSQFADRLRDKSPSEKNLLISLANDDFLCPYIPIPELFLPYVYESTVYSAKLEPEAGSMLVKRAVEMAKELY